MTESFGRTAPQQNIDPPESWNDRFTACEQMPDHADAVKCVTEVYREWQLQQEANRPPLPADMPGFPYTTSPPETPATLEFDNQIYGNKSGTRTGKAGESLP